MTVHMGCEIKTVIVKSWNTPVLAIDYEDGLVESVAVRHRLRGQ